MRNLTMTAGASSRDAVSADPPTGALSGFGLLFIAAMLAALPFGQRAAAGEPSGLLSKINAPAQPSSVCHRVDEVKATLFPKEQVVAYDFTGADANKLKGAMDSVAVDPVASIALVRLVLLPATDEAIAFQFGADGCHTMTIDVDFTAMAHLFQNAGVTAPFGATFYQIGGVPI